MWSLKIDIYILYIVFSEINQMLNTIPQSHNISNMKECYIFKANISERYLLLNFDILKCYKVKKRFSALKLKSKNQVVFI